MRPRAAVASVLSEVFRLFCYCLPPNRKWMRYFFDARSRLMVATGRTSSCAQHWTTWELNCYRFLKELVEVKRERTYGSCRKSLQVKDAEDRT